MARVFKRGKIWYADYRLNGRRVWKSVGKSKRLAEDYLKDVEGKIVRGEMMDLVEIRPINFDDFSRQYLDRYGVNKTESTRARDQITVNKHLIPLFGRRLLKQIAVSGVNYSFASATIRIPGGLCGKGSGVALLGVGFGVVAGRRGLAGFCPPEGGQTSRADGPCVLSI